MDHTALYGKVCECNKDVDYQRTLNSKPYIFTVPVCHDHRTVQGPLVVIYCYQGHFKMFSSLSSCFLYKLYSFLHRVIIFYKGTPEGLLLDQPCIYIRSCNNLSMTQPSWKVVNRRKVLSNVWSVICLQF